MTEKRGFQGVWIPAVLWNAEGLSWTEKCLIAEIDSLSSDEEPCHASAEFLAGRMLTTAQTVRNSLSELTQRGFLIQLGFDGKTAWRCVDPRFTSNFGKYNKWADPSPTGDGWHNPEVMRVITHRLQPPSPTGDREIPEEIPVEKSLRSYVCATHIHNHSESGSGASADLFGQSKARPADFETLQRFCTQIGLTWDDATFLWGTWQENGFKRGKAKIKDWKRCVRVYATGTWLPSRRPGYKPSPMQVSHYQRLQQAQLEAEQEKWRKEAEQWEANATPADREARANFLRMKNGDGQ